jgi:NhaP-type Na+/H+ or K+/H+ antiporter
MVTTVSLALNYLCIVFIILLSVAILGASWGFLLLLYVFVQLSRAVVVIVLYPLLRHFGYGMDIKEATVLVWSGLRGAVALSLSLSVKVSYFSCANVIDSHLSVVAIMCSLLFSK